MVLQKLSVKTVREVASVDLIPQCQVFHVVMASFSMVVLLQVRVPLLDKIDFICSIGSVGLTLLIDFIEVYHYHLHQGVCSIIIKQVMFCTLKDFKIQEILLRIFLSKIK